MHVNRGLLGWGVFFVALGAVPLAVQAGLIDSATARRAWELWPLLLIGAGVALVFRHTPSHVLGTVLIGLTFGLIVGGVVAGDSGPGSMGLCGIGSSTPSTANSPARTGTLASQASVELSVDCGSATATTQPGSDWTLTWPNGNSAPEVDASPSRLSVDMRSGNRFLVGEPRAEWALTLPADPTLDLSVSVNAGSAKLNLAAAKATSASLSVSAGDLKVDLGGSTGMRHVDGSSNAGSLSIVLPPPTAELTGSFSSNVGSMRICLPASVPVRVTVGGQTLGSTNLAQRGFVQNGDAWTRGAWDGASSRIDLDVSTNLGSVTFDPEGGCG